VQGRHTAHICNFLQYLGSKNHSRASTPNKRMEFTLMKQMNKKAVSQAIVKVMINE